MTNVSPTSKAISIYLTIKHHSSTRRIVDYRADDQNGFNAEVRRERVNDQVQQQQTQQQSGSSQTQTQTIQRIEVPVIQAIPRSFYTVQEFIAPSYSAVRRVNQQDQSQVNQQQESRYQARLTFRSPGLNYQY